KKRPRNQTSVQAVNLDQGVAGSVINASNWWHERDLQPRVEQRNSCHKKSDEREQQKKDCRARAQKEVSFSPRHSFHFRVPQVRFLSGSDGTAAGRSCR